MTLPTQPHAQQGREPVTPSTEADIAAAVDRLMNDLAFAAPELWPLHIRRRMEEVAGEAADRAAPADRIDVLLPLMDDRHYSGLPVDKIVRALRGRPLRGLWVQFHGDGTERVAKGEVVVSVQYGWAGSAQADEGRGKSVSAAASGLIDRLRGSR